MSENDSDVAGLAGTLLDGRFRVKRLIGRGGLSAVYLAEHEETGRSLAVKVLLPQFSHDQLKARRFQQEAKILHHLEHPNIAQMYSFGITGDGNIYLTLEYLDGRDLAQLIGGAPLDTGTIVSIFKQIALAISYAHQRQVVHRDLKPQNVMVVAGDSGSGKLVKVLDFGLAKLIAANSAEQQKLTATGVLLGTPAYMSPEQTSTAMPDSRSDVYSFGCMLYEALLGHPPFERENYPQLMSAHLQDAPPPIPPVPGDIARQALSRIALKCLEKKPDDRFQSMERVLELLEDIEVSGDADVDAIESPQHAGRWTVSRKWVIGAVCLAILLSALVVDLLALNQPPAPVTTDDDSKPSTALGFFQLGTDLRKRAQSAKTGTEHNQLLKEAAENYLRGVALSQNLRARRDNTWFAADCLAVPGMEPSDYIKAARTYEACAQLDKARGEATQLPNEQFDTRRDRTECHMGAAAVYMFRLGDLQKGREQAEQARLLGVRDRKMSYSSAWPTEMVARYDRQPKKAAACADQVISWLRGHAYKVTADQMQGLLEDAIIDYVSAGDTVKEAKAKVWDKLLNWLADARHEGVAAAVEKSIPDGIEKQLLPAYKQQSRLYPGKIPE